MAGIYSNYGRDLNPATICFFQSILSFGTQRKRHKANSVVNSNIELNFGKLMFFHKDNSVCVCETLK